MKLNSKVLGLLLFLFIGAGVFSMNVQPIEAASLAELQQYIEQLKAQIAELQAKLKLAQQQQSGEWCHTFSRNLKIGDTGEDVIALQTALKKQGFAGTDKDGSGRFSEFTASAVVGFQEKYSNEVLAQYGLKHGTGFVGTTTRAKLNKLYGCGVQIQPITPITPVIKDKPYCDAIGSKSEGWYENTGSNKQELIRWDNCNGCSAVCKYMGEEYEGWYSKGTCENSGTIIKYADCGEEEQQEPYIKVLSPNGGEKWVERNTYDITWEAKGITENFEIYLRDDRAGPSYKLVASEIPPSARIYSWQIPSNFWGVYTAGSAYKIQVREIGGKAGGGHSEGIYDESDNYFSIVAAETTSCTDTDNGINKYVQGTACRTLYNDPSAGIGVDPEFWGDSATFCRTDQCVVSPSSSSPLKGNINNSFAKNYVQEYYCKNGKIFSKTIYCENGCFNGACWRHISEDPAPSITVTFPNGGERWVVGETYQITWDAKTLDEVDITLVAYNSDGWLNKGFSYRIGSSVNADGGYYSWTPLNFADYPDRFPGFDESYQNYKIEIQKAGMICTGGSECIMDASNGYFHIVEGPERWVTVISPNGGEEWKFGETYDITWDSTGVDNVYLYWLWEEDGGICKIGSAQAIDSKYSITLEEGMACGTSEIISGNYRIHIDTFNDTPVVKDSSDNYFSIVEQD